ncbi:MAG: asparagine synthase (glutamine-hydrolyzing) [Lentisphaerae bacterium]|nr:asparagine synthase (glutamine-hydrolyzing) [Lentisphaerota bacterium]
MRAMASEMSHRGPDQEGVYCSDGISLAHRRLSIIDLSELGRQPMSNEDGSVQLSFNGEIYNFKELRPELERRGHVFRSQTDSEVIIHGYEEYGRDIVNKLRGMFAFAIWDSRTQTLFAARDRIGIKPLYYHHNGRRFLFASEIKAILQCREVPRRLNAQALYDYMGFEFVPAPDTMFTGIHKLPAGHLLELRDGKLKIEQYWDLPLGGNTLSYDDAVERQRELLDEAVQSHLMSDVPLGVFLSGGLDSSALVAMMRRHISGRLQTFTIGYKDRSFSELEYAQQVADYFGTDHHVLMIDGLNADYVEKALWHLDEPMTDLSTVPLMLVCEQARKHVTVCLSGEGGDESYAGYDRFKAAAMDRRYRMLPAAIRHHLVSPMVGALPDQPQKKGAINMLKRFVEGSDLPLEGNHLRWQYFSNSKQDGALFSNQLRDSIVADPFRLVRDYAARCAHADRINQQVYLDMRYMMTDSVLMKVDKMSMAHSLEIRVPLLDHVLVEFIASLPGDWKLKGTRTKHVFRSALKGMLPDTIVERGKQGYSLPVKQLLRDELKDYMVELLNESPIIQTAMQPATVNRLIDEHVAMKHNHNHVLWAMMNVAIWQRRFDVSC